jgi:molybdopterin/thiamine biosynthesis adenylyltransferase
MVVLDLLCRDERITRIILVEPDVYKSHNVYRHYFPEADVGQRKIDLAARWVRQFRPDIELELRACDLLDPTVQTQLEADVQSCHIGVCAVDNEAAKFAFDALLRKQQKPWTLGEVLSGGIGGWVHGFRPHEACYGCVASHLQRGVTTDNTPPPDYADPNAVVPETRIPASKAAINAIAGMHALATLDLLAGVDLGWTSWLLPLAKVDGVFAEAWKPFRFRIARSAECLICGANKALTGEDLDVELAQALARLGDE